MEMLLKMYSLGFQVSKQAHFDEHVRNVIVSGIFRVPFQSFRLLRGHRQHWRNGPDQHASDATFGRVRTALRASSACLQSDEVSFPPCRTPNRENEKHAPTSFARRTFAPISGKIRRTLLFRPKSAFSDQVTKLLVRFQCEFTEQHLKIIFHPKWDLECQNRKTRLSYFRPKNVPSKFRHSPTKFTFSLKTLRKNEIFAFFNGVNVSGGKNKISF